MIGTARADAHTWTKLMSVIIKGINKNNTNFVAARLG